MTKLTTITPYWGRPDALERWVHAVDGATTPEVAHILFFVGESVSPNLPSSINGRFSDHVPGEESIGYYHDMGATLCESEWIMKLDIDTPPHQEFFSRLLKVLESAPKKSWFNVGMIYVNNLTSRRLLSSDKLPLKPGEYLDIVNNRKLISSFRGYTDPQATNWVARTQEYLELGGSDPRFKGYGWEDYQQIYMLEKNRIGKDPLPGPVNLTNVTQRCRDEIARPRALQLFKHDPLLSLAHHWHPGSMGKAYKSHIEDNRKVLLDWITSKRV